MASKLLAPFSWKAGVGGMGRARVRGCRGQVRAPCGLLGGRGIKEEMSNQKCLFLLGLCFQHSLRGLPLAGQTSCVGKAPRAG